VFVIEDLDLRGCRGQKRFAYRALAHSLETRAPVIRVNPAYTRARAKRTLESMHDDIDREMREVCRTCGGVEITGIVGNTDRTPLDECGHVYKDLDDVLGVLAAEGIAEIAVQGK
jgi:hypothetical protein